MEFTLQRINDNLKSTTGEFRLPDFVLISMEDTNRDLNHDGDFNDTGEGKVWGKTRIPKGRYRIILREEGLLHEQYKERFSFHKGMLWLQNVPYFYDIYIHIFNKSSQSHGCIAPGISKISDDYITQSTIAYNMLYLYLLIFFSKGEEVWINILDEEA